MIMGQQFSLVRSGIISLVIILTVASPCLPITKSGEQAPVSLKLVHSIDGFFEDSSLEVSHPHKVVFVEPQVSCLVHVISWIVLPPWEISDPRNDTNQHEPKTSNFELNPAKIS